MKDFLERIFWIETQLQLKHWQETNGFLHEQLGRFYKKITKQFDYLVESYIGGNNIIAPLISESLYTLTNNMDNNNIILEIRRFILLLKENKEFQDRYFQNIVDDISSLTEQFSYLLNKK